MKGTCHLPPMSPPVTIHNITSEILSVNFGFGFIFLVYLFLAVNLSFLQGEVNGFSTRRVCGYSTDTAVTGRSYRCLPRSFWMTWHLTIGWGFCLQSIPVTQSEGKGVGSTFRHGN